MQARSSVPPGRAVAAAVGTAIAGIASAAVLTVVAGVVLGVVGVDLPLTAALVMTLVLTQGVAFGGVAAVYLAVRGYGVEFVPVRLPSLRDAGWTFAGYLVALAAALAAATLVAITGVETANNQVAELGVENPELLLWLVPFSFILIGPGEELLFRGVVQGTLRQAFGPWVAVGLASAIFAAIHWFALTGGAAGRVVSITLLFFPSLVFGAVYEYTDNLVVPALVHGAYNATLFSLVYVALKFAPQAQPGLL